MDNKKIIEYLESKGLNLSFKMPKIYLEEMEVTKKNIEGAKKNILEQVSSFFDDDKNYVMFKKDFRNSNIDFTDIVYKIKNIVNEYLEQQVKNEWQEMLEEAFVTTKVDAYKDEYKALNMEKLRGYLPEIEEQFNFIKNMSKEEILEFIHYEKRIDENGEKDVYEFCPVEILEYMNPEYIKDDEFVKKILHTFIVEYPYDRWENNEYYRLANDFDFPLYNINSNYSNFFDKLTPEQQTKFSSIVGFIEPGLTDIKEWPPYAVVEKLWDDREYCEILKHIEDEEDIDRKNTLKSNLKSYIEMLMDELGLMGEDETVEEIIGSDKFEFLTKLYTTEYGRDIIDDEQLKKILEDNKELLDERMQKEAELKKLQDEDKQCDETLAKAEQLEQIQENGNKTAVDD